MLLHVIGAFKKMNENLPPLKKKKTKQKSTRKGGRNENQSANGKSKIGTTDNFRYTGRNLSG